MSLLRVFICLAILFTSSQVAAISPNPFDKTIVVTASHDVTWKFGEQTATKSVKGADGTWYHLFYDGLLLRLRLTGSSHDSQYAAKQFEDFAVLDVKVDGKRLDVFQWCLNNQEKHNRFLQQDLAVKKEVCQNLGAQGSYVMRLTKETIDALDKGNNIEFELKPFRTKVLVKFSIDDFYKANNEFKKQYEAKLAASRPNTEQAPVAPVVSVAAPKQKAKAKCKIGPPRGFSEVKTISYDCNDIAAKNSARASVDSEVNKIREQRNKAEAEAERKRKEAEAARLAREEALRKEQEALAASAAVQAELSSEIAIKMIAVCEKKWAEGEHRCYCEKYIKYAPASIKANSSCK
jgi:hypothetical protein